ncbi:MAG: MBL fold metallo-hydrolase [Victivallales bacterium]|nr:MBL fold metallo-hydrolase [Victivallales bacterium]
MNKNFNLAFLGTEACDMDWSRYGEPGIYGSTQTLVNGTVLIDAGRTGFRSLARFQVAPESLEEVWFTHYHDDHCFPAEVAQIVQAHGTAAGPLVFRGTALLLEALRGALPSEVATQVAWTPFEVGHAFETHGWTVTPLLANHCDDLCDNLPVHYLVEGPCAKFLYALDGAWLMKKARNALQGKRLDAIVWDATVERPGDYRIFEHNDFTMIQTMVKALVDAAIVDANTRLVLDHLARSLWQNPIRVPAPYLVAEDGMELEF